MINKRVNQIEDNLILDSEEVKPAYTQIGELNGIMGVVLPVDPSGFVLITKEGVALTGEKIVKTKVQTFKNGDYVAFQEEELNRNLWLVGRVKEILHGCVLVIQGNDRVTYAISMLDNVRLLKDDKRDKQVELSSKYPYQWSDLALFYVGGVTQVVK